MRKRKYKYLYQLIFTSSILIIVPTLFFFHFFWKKSFDEINRINTEYYENMSELFCGTFVNEVSQLKQYASAFSVNSRDSIDSAGIFYEGTEKMSENAYYYWEACRELKEYSKKIGYDAFGVYYFDKDIILYDGGKYSKDDYIQKCLFIEKKREQEQFVRLTEFFSGTDYEQTKVIFAPVYDSQGRYKKLLIGIHSILGKDKEKALIFYEINPEDMEFFYLSAQGRAWEKYYVVYSSTGEVLFQVVNAAESAVEESRNSDLLAEYNEAVIDRKDKGREVTFVKTNKSFDLTFVMDVSGDEEQNNIYRFYSDMKSFMAYILLIMAAVCALAVYYNYRPIYSLLEKIKGSGENEFDTILNIWEAQSVQLTEQRMLIMDLLMNHLIYGMPISEENVSKLGVSKSVTNYCVFLIEKYVLTSREVEQVMDGIEKEFSTLLFITDLQGEKSTIIVAFLEKDNAEPIKNWLAWWCSLHVKEEYSLRTGNIVSQLDEIRSSLLSCREQFEAVPAAGEINEEEWKQESVSESARSRAEAAEKLKQDILDYLEENFTSQDLSQTKVADCFQISVYTLSRLFKNQFGIGFTEYVNGKRLEYARELLLSTTLSVKEIAGMAGISNDNYFSRIFRQYMGMSPTEFRAKNKQ